MHSLVLFLAVIGPLMFSLWPNLLAVSVCHRHETAHDAVVGGQGLPAPCLVVRFLLYEHPEKDHEVRCDRSRAALSASGGCLGWGNAAQALNSISFIR